MATLYRKYRPQAWADVAGQDHVKAALGYQVTSGQVAHAYLFSGPRGVGKTTIARLFARAICCSGRKEGSAEPCGACPQCETMLGGMSLDLIEIDAASHRGIDTVRESIIEAARFAPSQLPYKTFIIDEVHMLTTEAFNALLKTLEEPPAKTVFILATTELYKVPATIASRCQRFDFRTIPFGEMVGRLRGVAEKEGVKVEDATLEAVARASDGCERDAESLLGQVLGAAKDGSLSHADASLLLPRNDLSQAIAFVSASLDRKPAAAFAVLASLEADGADADAFADEASALLRQALLLRLGAQPPVALSDGQQAQLQELLSRHSAARIADMLEITIAKRRQATLSPLPFLPLELVAARMSEEASAPAPAPATKAPVSAAPPAPAPKPVAPAPAPAAPAAEKKPELASAPAPELTPAPVAAIAEPAPEADLSGPPVVAVEAVAAKWAALISLVGQEQPSLSFILAGATPTAVLGSTVEIGFNFPFHRDKCNEGKNRLALEKALSGLLGVAVLVRGTVLEKKNEMGQTDPGPSAPANSASVDALASAFGGKVVG